MNCIPVLGLSLLIGAPGVKDPPKKAEAPSLVGEWECVEMQGGGRVVPAAMVPKFVYEFTADGKFLSRTDEGGDRPKGTYTTNPSKDPAEVDYGSDGDRTKQKAIYKVEDGILILCYTEARGDRQAKFESTAGTRILLLKFKRIEKKKE